ACTVRRARARGVVRMSVVAGRGGGVRLRARAAALLGAVAALGAGGPHAWAETLQSALIQAYQNNPQLNAQRASARATDEGVPQALSGYRPRLSVTATLGETYLSQTSKSVSASKTVDPVTGTTTNLATYNPTSGYFTPYTYGASMTQTLFN